MNEKHIPKVIHYIWFGNNDLPEEAVACIESWKKFCPDYEIKRWGESNFDLSSNNYVKQAYEAKKWAFVSDYARLWILVNEGGIYMDTDVEVLKSLDPFLTNRAFSGFESDSSVPTGIMACEKGFPLFRKLLNDYDVRSFIKSDGSYDLTTNVVVITKACKALGLKLDNTMQTVDGFTLYPSDWFCPKSHESGDIHLTENSVTIHHFNGSWIDEVERGLLKERRRFLTRHSWLNPMLAGLIVRLQYGFKTNDFRPLTSALKAYFANRH